jgi:hypothetical protein
MKHAIRAILAVGIIAVFSLSLGVVPSSAATGPFFIKTLNANVCVKATPDQAGTLVIQGDYDERDCRKLFFDRIGFVNGFPYGEWETAGGHALAAATCGDGTPIHLAAEHATGTSWVTYIQMAGQQRIINKRCDGQAGSNCSEALSASVNLGQPWVLLNWRQHHGTFTNLAIIRQSAPLTARAGC